MIVISWMDIVELWQYFISSQSARQLSAVGSFHPETKFATSSRKVQAQEKKLDLSKTVIGHGKFADQDEGAVVIGARKIGDSIARDELWNIITLWRFRFHPFTHVYFSIRITNTLVPLGVFLAVHGIRREKDEETLGERLSPQRVVPANLYRDPKLDFTLNYTQFRAGSFYTSWSLPTGRLRSIVARAMREEKLTLYSDAILEY